MGHIVCEVRSENGAGRGTSRKSHPMDSALAFPSSGRARDSDKWRCARIDLDAAYSVDVPAKDVAEFAKRTEAKLKSNLNSQSIILDSNESNCFSERCRGR
jgi:hypothetical protein